MKTNTHCWSYLAQFFLEWEIFQSDLQRKSKHTFCVQSLLFFSKILAFVGVMWKVTVQRGMPQMAIWRMRISRRITKAAYLNAEYVKKLLSHCNNGYTNAPQYYLLTYLLTHAMVQSPSWTANWFAASQEIPLISRNPKVHYCTHKRPPPFPILGQPNPVHIPTSHLLEIHRNIIHPSTPRSPQWSPSLRFPHQDPIHRPLLTHTRHMPSPSHSSPFYHPHNIGWAVQII